MYRIDPEVAKYLEKTFSNLPPSLEQLYLLYDTHDYDEHKIMTVTKNYSFNLLFAIKIPLNCDLVVKFGRRSYKINYVDKNKIELKYKTMVHTIFYKEHTIPVLTPLQNNYDFEYGYIQRYNYMHKMTKSVMVECMDNFISNLCGATKSGIDKKIDKKLLYSSNKYLNKNK